MTKRRRRSEAGRRIQGEKAKTWWAAMSDEQRAEIRAQQRATYETKHAEQVALRAELRRQIEVGELVPEPCDRGCGSSGMPILRGLEVIGWRCYPCRNAKETPHA